MLYFWKRSSLFMSPNYFVCWLAPSDTPIFWWITNIFVALKKLESLAQASGTFVLSLCYLTSKHALYFQLSNELRAVMVNALKTHNGGARLNAAVVANRWQRYVIRWDVEKKTDRWRRCLKSTIHFILFWARTRPGNANYNYEVASIILGWPPVRARLRHYVIWSLTAGPWQLVLTIGPRQPAPVTTGPRQLVPYRFRWHLIPLTTGLVWRNVGSD